jgi:hypothetical protein
MTTVNLTTGVITVLTNGQSHISKIPASMIEDIFGKMLNKGMNFRKVKATDNLKDVNEGDNAFIEV